MKKSVQKLFKKEFPKLDISVNDIFTDGMLKPKKRFDMNLYWKYSSICTTVLLIISLVFIGVIMSDQSIENNEYQFINDIPVNFTEDNNVLSNEEIDELRKYCEYGFKYESAYLVEVDENVDLYIFEGKTYKLDGEGGHINQTVYIYVFDYQEEDFNIIIRNNEFEAVVNKNNRYGILGIIDENEPTSIKFSLSYLDKVTKYLFEKE
ncbi:MAG: hypothetical protein IJX78_07220 [Bacilli bacterium]|nr:hypothetical protein [Bacilli bacterium]